MSKRIVMLCGYRIFPPSTGGNVHSTTIARALARLGHQVLVYCLAGRREDYSLGKALGGSYSRVSIEHNLEEETNLNAGFGLLQALFRRAGIPRVWQYELLRRGIIPRRLKRELLQADLIMCDFPFCPPVPGPWAGKPWFMVSHELEFKLFEQVGGMEGRFAGRMRAIEAAAPRTYRDIFVCAQEDRDFFRAEAAGAGLKLPYIRCGVDAKMYAPDAGARARIRAELELQEEDWLFLFSGSRYGPNVESYEVLQQFCRTEAAFLRDHRIFLLVLGSVAPAARREDALIVTGPVPEVIPYFSAADAGLNPITRGSGSNVKLFEYLVSRLPVISTPFGVRGTELLPDIDYLPYEAAALKPALQRFLSLRSRREWQEHGAEVLKRHFRFCDIQELVRDAVAQRPEFN